jgi:hypothetical protein
MNEKPWDGANFVSDKSPFRRISIIKSANPIHPDEVKILYPPNNPKSTLTSAVTISIKKDIKKYFDKLSLRTSFSVETYGECASGFAYVEELKKQKKCGVYNFRWTAVNIPRAHSYYNFPHFISSNSKMAIIAYAPAKSDSDRLDHSSSAKPVKPLTLDYLKAEDVEVPIDFKIKIGFSKFSFDYSFYLYCNFKNTARAALSHSGPYLVQVINNRINKSSKNSAQDPLLFAITGDTLEDALSATMRACANYSIECMIDYAAVYA